MRMLSKLFVALAAMLSLAVQAQEPPGRAGRLAYAEGSVSVYMDPDLGWEPGYLNTPLTSENSVWTDIDSRAEVRVSGIAMRLDETTQLDIAEISDSRVDSMLVRGAINVRIRHLGGNDRVAVSTENARFILLGPGRYRIDADPERGDSRLTVFEGRAAMRRSGEQRVTVPAGESVVVWGDRPMYAMQRAFTTPLDGWASTRDERWVERTSTRYVSTYMTGYEDLDPYGEWIQDADYGALWIPTRVESGWAPYRYGRWSYVRPWGWTWIDDQPWGYAPFHYGRWVQVRDRWAWYPGRRTERPLWAPALVAWVGGSNFSIGVSSGPSVGWYPLSPFERYQPWYRANATYVNNVNLNFVFTERDRAWRYRDRQREFTRTQATVIPREALLTRRQVQQVAVRVAPEVLRQQTQAAQQPAAVLPTRADVVRTRAERQQVETTARAQGGAAATARPGTPPAASAASTARALPPGATPPAPQVAPPSARPQFARDPKAPEPQAAAKGATPPPAEAVSRAMPPGQERSRFGPGTQPPAPGMPPSAKGQEAIERRDARADQREQERAAREAQQQQARDAQQQQQAREAQQRQQQEQSRQQQQQQQEQARQQQERAQREQQEKGQRDAQERAQREGQQRQQQEQARQQQQQQEQARQQQEKAQREQQEKGQRDAQERAQREQQQRQQQEQARQQQQQQEQARQQQEKAQRDAQERAQREQQRQQQEQARQQQQRGQPAPPPAQPAQAQQPAPPPAAPAPARGRDKGSDKGEEEEKEKEKEKGRNKGR